MVDYMVQQFALLCVSRESLDQTQGLLIVRLHYARCNQLEDAESQSKQSKFSRVGQLIPEFKSGLKTEGSAEDGEEPFHQKDLGVDSLQQQLLCDVRVVFEQKEVEAASHGGHEMWFEGEEPAKEGVCKNEVAENAESFRFACHQGQHDDWVGHALHIAHIWPVEMEQFQHLTHLRPQPRFLLILRDSRERATNILVYLSPHFPRNPPRSPPLQQLQVELVSDSQVVVHCQRPHKMPQFVGNHLLRQICSFLSESMAATGCQLVHSLQPVSGIGFFLV